jgi:hypothetical protein
MNTPVLLLRIVHWHVLDHDAIRRNRIMTSSLLIEHDLFGKPVSTFPDHALAGHVPADKLDFLARKSRRFTILQTAVMRES